MRHAPNILLIVCDQLRAFEVGCYGNDVVQTPGMDRLAADGVRFETAITQFPVCMAARSVLLTGQYNRTCTGGVANVAAATQSGEHHMPEYPAHGRPHLRGPVLSASLREFGYHTEAIGKWHIHSWPHDVGFARYLIPRVHHCHTGQSFTQDGGPEFVPDGYSVDFEATRVEEFLAERSPDSPPFFLYYNISPPHCPLSDAPDRYTGMYLPENVPLRPNVDPNRPPANQAHWLNVYRWDFRYYSHHLPYTETLPDGFDIRGATALYYGLVTWADEAIGRALAALDAAGLAEDTIVALTSDHGDNLGSHGLVQKGTPTEEALRVPLLVRWPRRGRGRHVVTDQVAGLVDVAPTLLSLAGVPLPDGMHGRDLSPLVLGTALPGAAPSRPAGYFETPEGAGVRTLEHLCFVPFDGDTRRLSQTATHLYDLREDPYQQNNLAGTGRQPHAESVHHALVAAWDRETPWMEPSVRR